MTLTETTQAWKLALESTRLVSPKKTTAMHTPLASVIVTDIRTDNEEHEVVQKRFRYRLLKVSVLKPAQHFRPSPFSLPSTLSSVRFSVQPF